MKKAYIGEEGKQIHYRELAARNETGNLPLLCLAPSPHSGLNYTSIMPLLNEHRRVISVDYPGFGGSDPLDGEPSIEGYADSVLPLIESLGPVDTMSFHSGTLVNLELALKYPELMAKIVLIDIPYFDVETRKSYDEKMGGIASLPTETGDLTNEFDIYYANRLKDMDQTRCYDLWVEFLRAGAGRNAIYHAAFTYDCENKFPALERPVNVVATQSPLLEATREAVKVLPNPISTEILEVTRAVFELGKEKTAETVLNILAA